MDMMTFLSGTLSMLAMIDDHDERVVDRYEGDDLVVDTCAVTDSSRAFETGIKSPRYHDGSWVIVESYDTKEDAQAGHDKWVGLMTQSPPDYLVEDGEAFGGILRGTEYPRDEA
jgi:hypothetical protein